MVALKLLLLNVIKTNFDKNKQTFTLYFVSCQPNKHSFYSITDNQEKNLSLIINSLKKKLSLSVYSSKYYDATPLLKLLRILNLIKFELSIAS